MSTREEDAAIISRNLKRLCAERGLTQVDLAKAIHENKSTVNLWFMGKAIPRFPKFSKIADYLGVRISDITEANATEDYDLVFTDVEKQFVVEYRKLGKADREAIERVFEYAKMRELVNSMEQKKGGTE